MASEIVTNKNPYPIISPQQPISRSKGRESMAQVLGQIAERSMQKAESFASEASKANMLQTHSMLQDVENKSKLEMMRSPGNAEAIAKNAEDTIKQITSGARLNRGDRQSLDATAHSMTSSLMLSGAEKSISLARMQAAYSQLEAFDNTNASIQEAMYTNPELAEKLIEAQYESLRGSVASGVMTPTQAFSLHKQLSAHMQLSHELAQGIESGILSAANVNAVSAASTSQVPFSNAGLPIDNHTAMASDHYYGHYTVKDLKARMDQGERIPARDLAGLKPKQVDEILNYGSGSIISEGHTRAATRWDEMEHRLDELNKIGRRSTKEEGERNRLNRFFLDSKKPGFYEDYMSKVPEGARILENYRQKEAVIDSSVLFGDEEDVARLRGQLHAQNINDRIAQMGALGLGMNYPDNRRQPIPAAIITPIMNGFAKRGDVVSAIQNIQMLTPENRVYAMNAFPDDPRKQLTIYEAGNLVGNVDNGFLIDLMQSQQDDSLGLHNTGKKDAQEKFLQLQTGKDGYSDNKLIGLINPSLARINQYLAFQSESKSLQSAKTDQALRYIKQVANNNNDYTFEHAKDYVRTFSTNMEKAYGIESGYNYLVSTNDVPLDKSDAQDFASVAIQEAKDAMMEFKTRAETDRIFSENGAMLVSSPGGRLEVIFANGQVVPDKHGKPAYSHIYTKDLHEHTMHTLSEMPKRGIFTRYPKIEPILYSDNNEQEIYDMSYGRGQ
jgi:hypothetical protein